MDLIKPYTTHSIHESRPIESVLAIHNHLANIRFVCAMALHLTRCSLPWYFCCCTQFFLVFSRNSFAKPFVVSTSTWQSPWSVTHLYLCVRCAKDKISSIFMGILFIRWYFICYFLNVNHTQSRRNTKKKTHRHQFKLSIGSLRAVRIVMLCQALGCFASACRYLNELPILSCHSVQLLPAIDFCIQWVKRFNWRWVYLESLSI